MTLQTSGPISVDNIETELKVTARSTLTLNDTNVRSLFKLPTDKSTIRFSDGYGKSSRINLVSYISSGTYYGYTINVATLSGYSATNAGTYDVTIQANTGAIIMPPSGDLGNLAANTSAATGSSLNILGLSSNDTITIVMNGCVMGRGGDGGTYSIMSAQDSARMWGRPAVRIKGTPSALTLKGPSSIGTTANVGFYGGGGGGSTYQNQYLYNISGGTGTKGIYFSCGGGGAGGGMGGLYGTSYAPSGAGKGATTFGSKGTDASTSTYFNSNDGGSSFPTRYDRYISGGSGGGFILPTRSAAVANSSTGSATYSLGGGGGGSAGITTIGTFKTNTNYGAGAPALQANPQYTGATPNYAVRDGRGSNERIDGSWPTAGSYASMYGSNQIYYGDGTYGVTGGGGGGGWGGSGGSTASEYLYPNTGGAGESLGGGAGFAVYLEDFEYLFGITVTIENTAVVFGEVGYQRAGAGGYTYFRNRGYYGSSVPAGIYSNIGTYYNR
jgi:hypothetical protein